MAQLFEARAIEKYYSEKNYDIKKEVSNLSEMIINSSPIESLVQRILSKHLLQPITLLDEKPKFSADTQSDRLIIYISFSGDRTVLTYRPTSYELREALHNAEVLGKDIVLTYSTKNREEEELISLIDHDIEFVKNTISSLTLDILRLNSQAIQALQKEIEEKRAAIVSQKAIANRLKEIGFTSKE